MDQIEDPRTFDPWVREHWVEVKLKTTPMRGIIDRLDYLGDTTQGVPRVRIVDYKTGKPSQKRYLDESLFPIYTYAAAQAASTEVKVETVQLLYINHGPTASITREINQRTNQKSAREFNDVWKKIVKASKAGRFPCKPGPLCDWCDAKVICPDGHDSLYFSP
jgi:putative RecB family exonuclease